MLETEGMCDCVCVCACACVCVHTNATHMSRRERKQSSCAVLQLKEGDFHRPLIKPPIPVSL